MAGSSRVSSAIGGLYHMVLMDSVFALLRRTMAGRVSGNAAGTDFFGRVRRLRS
jgi:hypothetical protein